MLTFLRANDSSKYIVINYFYFCIYGVVHGYDFVSIHPTGLVSTDSTDILDKEQMLKSMEL